VPHIVTAACRRLATAAVLAFMGWAGAVPASAQSNDAVARGAYLVRAGGCIACHTVPNGGAPLAGGRALATPFGTYYSPNITPDKETGIGAWSDADFVRALRDGVSPDGGHYFPVFPFTSYTRMREDDMLAIKAWLFSQPAVRQPAREHDVGAPFGWRWTMWFWKLLFFEPGELQPQPDRSDVWNRGAYLVEALAHCGECHTPRNLFGATDRSLYLAGTTEGPDDELVPNITPHSETGIGDWSRGDIVILLRDGLKPDFDDVQGSMAEAIEDGLRHLDDADLQAIAEFVAGVPAIDNRIESKRR